MCRRERPHVRGRAEATQEDTQTGHTDPVPLALLQTLWS